MAEHGEFVWADLSGFRPTNLRMFYADVFGWHYTNTDAYASAWSGKTEVAAIYEMPSQFQDMGMPPFWMSYIGTQNLDQTCEMARRLGGKVELGPEPFDDHGQIALIRDPLGAGFTAYQGSRDVPTNFQPGHRMGHGLFVSDAAKVEHFYSTLFGWTFDPIADGPIAFRKNHQIVGYCHQIPDASVRGPEHYWAVYFDTENLQRSISLVESSGGQLVAQLDLPEGKGVFAKDPDGAVFVLVGRDAGNLDVLDWITSGHVWGNWMS